MLLFNLEEDYENVGNSSHEAEESDFLKWRNNRRKSMEEGEVSSGTAVLNPTICLHLDDILLFTVNTRQYPQYDM